MKYGNILTCLELGNEYIVFVVLSFKLSVYLKFFIIRKVGKIKLKSISHQQLFHVIN